MFGARELEAYFKKKLDEAGGDVPSRGNTECTVQTFRYLPLSSLEACDTCQEKGLDRLIYIQALIDEDCDS